MSDGSKHQEVVSKVETPPSRSEHGLLGELRGDDPDHRRKMIRQLTGASWVLAAGAYGYLAASFGSEYPEYGGIFLLLGVGIGAGMAGLLALTGGDDDGE